MNSARPFGTAVFDLSLGGGSMGRRRRSMRARWVDPFEKLMAYTVMLAGIADRPRHSYTGSSRGKCWANIVVEPCEKAWQLHHAEKMGCLGPEVRPVGGRPRADGAGVTQDFEEEPVVTRYDTMPPVPATTCL